MPPVSSRTTSRSVPSIRSRFSGLASSRASLGRTGRRFANSPSPLRRPSSPCSGRGLPGSVVSHFGPPTAQRRTASDRRQASSTCSVRAVPCSSIEAPPIRCSVILKSPSASSACLAAAPSSGPIPSPGRRATLGTVGLDVEAHVVEGERLALEIEPRLRTPPPLLLGQPRQMRPHRHGRGEGVGVLRLHRLVLQPAPDPVEARVAQALLSLIGGREVPHDRHLPKVLAELRPARNRDDVLGVF